VLRIGGIDYIVIHLVRDPLAVVRSQLKYLRTRGVPRSLLTPLAIALRSSFDWVLANLVTERIEVTHALTPGCGEDPARVSPVEEWDVHPLVGMLGRMLWSKGVEECVEAARVCRTSIDARVLLVGDPDPGNPSPVPELQLEAWHRAGWVEGWRHRDDIPQVISRASVVVLPTRYAEGVPQALIEAAAM
jgi:glycosyltransferase involved in cell wall biosynthesis